MKKKLQVQLKEKSYPIFFEKNLFRQRTFYDRCLEIASSFVLITQTSLIQEIALPLIKTLRQKKIPCLVLSFPPGEKHKTRKTKEYLENQMLLASIDRQSAILSLGGGVVSDMAGFVAATYMRSLPLIHVPTTLLGMIDAAVGGKTAVNTSFGKNTIGTIYQPKAVFIDSTFVNSLSKEEFQNGMVEMIKYALLFDPNLFSLLEEKNEKILMKKELFEKMIFTCVSIKKKVIEEDENDNGVRQLLGLGHTLAHALEASSNYQLSHGAAVRLGILGESFLSMKKNLLPKHSFERICALFSRLESLTSPSSFSKRKVLSFLLQDKKRKGGKVSFVLLADIGYPFVNSSGYLHVAEKEEMEEMLSFIEEKVQLKSLCSSLS
jgi:3-dehydroquinate synthase